MKILASGIYPPPKFTVNREATRPLNGLRLWVAPASARSVIHATRRLSERIQLPMADSSRPPTCDDIVISSTAHWPTNRAMPEFGTVMPGPQAYLIDVAEDSVNLRGADEAGARWGVESLRQMTCQSNGQLTVGRIEDRPQFAERAAGWLINCEVNRWAYDYGDGKDAYIARVHRKLEFAAEQKLNMVYFDGFGWDANRFDGYAEMMREFNQYARNLGISLVFGGYGCGYGFAYQLSIMYSYPYYGQVFENRHPYPDGGIYTCRGLPNHPTSRILGSCLANEEMARDKLRELTEFVRAVEPGGLYIHDIDTGDLASNAESWLNRCARCREIWPDDHVESPLGLAGAVVNWYEKLVENINGVVNDESGYAAAHDCQLLLTGPMYTHHTEDDDAWAAEVQYFVNVSQMLVPAENVQFTIREQFANSDGSPRVQQLAYALERVGRGHGVHVAAFGGGDRYQSDDPVNLCAGFADHWKGARSVYVSGPGLHSEHVQAMIGAFLWNGELNDWRGGDREEFLHGASNGLRPAEICGKDGALHMICERLYPGYGTTLAEALCFGAPGTGRWPVAIAWWTVMRIVAAIYDGKPLPDGELARLKDCEELSREAADMLEAADSLPSELRWLHTCLHMTADLIELCRKVAEYSIDNPSAPVGVEELKVRIAHLRAEVRHVCACDFTDPLGGDPGCWLDALQTMEKTLDQTENSPFVD